MWRLQLLVRVGDKLRYYLGLGLRFGTGNILNYFVIIDYASLFAKLPWPADSKMTFVVFESSCHLLLPV